MGHCDSPALIAGCLPISQPQRNIVSSMTARVNFTVALEIFAPRAKD
jgi:hypothetical protein